MMIEIKSRWDDKVLFSVEAESLKTALEIAVKQKADLRGAYLWGAYLWGADLWGADLGGAYLRGADLGGAYLRGADLRGADLNFCSHDLIAEILRRAAEGNPDKLKIAGLILLQREWCWEQFFKLKDPLTEWALVELRKWVTDKTPPEIKKYLGAE